MTPRNTPSHDLKLAGGGAEVAGPSAQDVANNAMRHLNTAGPDGGLPNIVMMHASDLWVLIASHDALIRALKPFAEIAGPIKGEAGRPTYLEAIMRVSREFPEGETEELAVTTIFDTGGRGAVLWADDFKCARAALSRALSPSVVGSGEGSK